MKELPNKREVECCASCKHHTYGYGGAVHCKKHEYFHIEPYWLCDDYKSELNKREL